MFTDYFSTAVSVPAPPDGERVLTFDELARQFHVSKKNRFPIKQTAGLSEKRRFLFDGCRQIGFLQSSVDRFVAENTRAGSPRGPNSAG